MNAGVLEANACASECWGVMEAREPGQLRDPTRIGVVLAETIGGFNGEVRGELELKVCG